MSDGQSVGVWEEDEEGSEGEERRSCLSRGLFVNQFPVAGS